MILGLWGTCLENMYPFFPEITPLVLIAPDSTTVQLAFPGPVRRLHVLENDVYVLGVGAGVARDAFGDFGCNGLLGRCVLAFKPADAYDGHDWLLGISK